MSEVLDVEHRAQARTLAGLNGGARAGSDIADLEALVEVWKQRLALRDWHVTVVEMNDRTSTPGEQNYHYGRIDANAYRRTATMQIWPQEFRRDLGALDLASPERTVVHELLHLWLTPFQHDECRQDGSPRDIAHEQACNALALALVTAYEGRR